MMTPEKTARWALVFAALLCGCHGDSPAAPEPAAEPDSPESPDTVTMPPAARGASVEVSAVTDTAAGTITFVVRINPNGVAISSFQGRVTFDPAAFDLVSHVLPSGQSGQAFLANTTMFAEGRIRFAAFTPLAFSADSAGFEALRFTVRPRGDDTESPEGTLDVVGTPAGARMATGGTGGTAAAIGAQTCSGGLWGDANDDGNVDISDAQQIARHGVGLTVANPDAVAGRGDVTADGAVNIADAQQIARFGVGLSAVPRVSASLCD
jgi:hypothetical protein